MGIDNIGPRILKCSALALYQPLHHLFISCLSQHCIPNEWRIHLIVPIHKSGDKASVKNYRPISLLCSISKVLEKIVYDKIIDFVASRVNVAQFGFLQNRSSLHQLLLFLKNIFDGFKINSQTDVIYLDFRKAFDSVAHNELLAKLWHFGITGNLWKWFRGYLSSRMQCVKLDGILSHPLPVVSGVPQGSILGPLLFLIFINDIPETVTSSDLLLFADDTKCFKTIGNPSDCHSLQQDLQQLSDQNHLWNQHFNENKCVCIHLTTKGPITHQYCINDVTVSVQTQHRDLGIIISSDLSWDEHYMCLLHVHTIL